jgi:hypothetical protein
MMVVKKYISQYNKSNKILSLDIQREITAVMDLNMGQVQNIAGSYI